MQNSLYLCAVITIFIMSNDNNKKTLAPWWKGFLTSILGTTISILLTFGTTALVNSKKKENAQRLTAMMIIQDIDNSIETLRNIIEEEENCYNAAQYALSHIDSIATMPSDTLEMVVEYIMPGMSISMSNEFDDSKERIFHSSQDSWNNLNDVAFIDNMEEFYKTRRMIQGVLKTGEDMYLWLKPISKEEAIHAFQDGCFDSLEEAGRYVESKLKEKRVRRYIEYYFQRKQGLQALLEGWSSINEENKFLMNITEEDLKAFEESTIKKSHTAKEKDIIGSWIDSVVVEHTQEYDFRKDHTFTKRISRQIAIPLYSGKIVRIVSLEGTWTIEGDSIIIVNDSSTCQLSVDDSHISYPEEMRDSVKRFINRLITDKQLKVQKIQIAKDGGRRAWATNINLTGNSLELTDPKDETTHFKRKKRE